MRILGCRVTERLATVVAGLVAACMSLGWHPAPDGAVPSPPVAARVIRLPSGVEVTVSAPAGADENDRVAEALEAALQQVRAGEQAEPAAAEHRLAELQTAEPDASPAIPSALGAVEGPVPAPGVAWDACPPMGPLDVPWVWKAFPSTLLWRPPIAQPGQPRSYVMLSTAKEYYTKDSVETAIGLTQGVVRFGACDDPRHAFQVDAFAVAFSRFSQTSRLLATDYRFGLPITFAWGAWEGKIGYEHTSTHIGDEYLQVTNDFRRELIRDEFVAALGYRFLNQFRVYGQFAYAPGLLSPGDEDRCDRYNVGVEWYRDERTSWRGQPYAAVDADIRGDQDYELNLTVQIGWQWRDPACRPAVRVGAEYYNGRSLYGHFSDEKEHWAAIGFFVDY